MSAPLTAGGAAVVRDFYQKAHSRSASAALVKATLINSAVDMLDENNDGVNDNDFPIPNVHEGWGRVNLVNATDGSHKFAEHTAGVSTGGKATYKFSVNTGGAHLKVTLVWSDYPSTETAAKNLVNDLDLVVTAPDGVTTYLGNVFSGGWSQTGGSADRTNNVENVYVRLAAAGTWTLEVRGYNVANGPQPFALVVDGSGDWAGCTSNCLRSTDITLSAKQRGGKVNVTGAVTVKNEAGAVVKSATVYITWTLPNGTTQNQSALTNKNGLVSFSTSDGNGTYTLTVTNIVKTGYTFDPANSVLSKSITK
jgi:hypothetical protein